MATYQFTALDQSGNEKRGTIEAGTQQEAYAAIQSHGLQPTNVFAANQARDVLADRAPTPGLRKTSSAAGMVGLILSIIAILVALTALGWQIFRPNPLGKGMSAYDFSTPKAAVRSQLEIEQNLDVIANIELGRIRRSPELEEKLRTLEVRKQESWKDTTVVFFSFQRKEVKQHRAQAFKKDAKSGYWIPWYDSIEDGNPELVKRMRAWEQTGKLD